jgi:ABC-2 type transport system ATP-binding protein
VNHSTVELAGVSKAFGRTRALAGVTLELAPGITGLLGPNGAGKTTLLRILATVLAPDEGHVRLLGLDPSDPEERTDIRRRLGYLPQDAGLHRGFTAFEFVDYVAILKEMTERDTRHAEVRRVLDLVGLGEVRGRKIKGLSGGMRRRVALAQALLGQPELLLLDEPTAGLDPEQRLRFRELVSAAPNQTVVISTHQTEDVAALCARVVVLDQGVARFDGAPRELAALAQGKVWLADERAPGARLSWRTGDGAFRHIGQPPPTARLVEPTVEDGYLLLLGPRAIGEEAA